VRRFEELASPLFEIGPGPGNRKASSQTILRFLGKYAFSRANVRAVFILLARKYRLKDVIERSKADLLCVAAHIGKLGSKLPFAAWSTNDRIGTCL